MDEKAGSDLDDLMAAVRRFAEVRDWGQFHSPKNLVMALAGEVGELCDLFRWLTPEQSQRVMEATDEGRPVEDELADVLIYLLRLSDVLGVHLGKAALRKLEANELRYPVAKSRGNPRKYTELD
jgi:dCTP diphosphatase